MDPVVYLLRKTLGPASAAAVGCFLLLFCCFFLSSLLTWLPTAHFGGGKIDPIQQCASVLLVFVVVGIRIG